MVRSNVQLSTTWILCYFCATLITSVNAYRRPSVSCLLYGDKGCEWKCYIKSLWYKCKYNASCDWLYCNCNYTYQKENLKSTNAPNTLSDFLESKFVENEALKQVRSKLIENPLSEKILLHKFQDSNIPPDDVKRHLLLKYPKSRFLIRQLIPKRNHNDDDDDLSAELFEGKKSENGILDQIKGYFGGFFNTWPFNFGYGNNFKKDDLNSEQNRERILNLVKQAKSVKDVKLILKQLKSSGNEPLYNFIVGNLGNRYNVNVEAAKYKLDTKQYSENFLKESEKVLERTRNKTKKRKEEKKAKNKNRDKINTSELLNSLNEENISLDWEEHPTMTKSKQLSQSAQPENVEDNYPEIGSKHIIDTTEENIPIHTVDQAGKTAPFNLNVEAASIEDVEKYDIPDFQNGDKHILIYTNNLDDTIVDKSMNINNTNEIDIDGTLELPRSKQNNDAPENLVSSNEMKNPNMGPFIKKDLPITEPYYDALQLSKITEPKTLKKAKQLAESGVPEEVETLGSSTPVVLETSLDFGARELETLLESSASEEVKILLQSKATKELETQVTKHEPIHSQGQKLYYQTDHSDEDKITKSVTDIINNRMENTIQQNGGEKYNPEPINESILYNSIRGYEPNNEHNGSKEKSMRDISSEEGEDNDYIGSAMKWWLATGEDRAQVTEDSEESVKHHSSETNIKPLKDNEDVDSSLTHNILSYSKDKMDSISFEETANRDYIKLLSMNGKEKDDLESAHHLILNEDVRNNATKSGKQQDKIIATIRSEEEQDKTIEYNSYENIALNAIDEKYKTTSLSLETIDSYEDISNTNDVRKLTKFLPNEHVEMTEGIVRFSIPNEEMINNREEGNEKQPYEKDSRNINDYNLVSVLRDKISSYSIPGTEQVPNTLGVKYKPNPIEGEYINLEEQALQKEISPSEQLVDQVNGENFSLSFKEVESIESNYFLSEQMEEYNGESSGENLYYKNRELIKDDVSNHKYSDEIPPNLKVSTIDKNDKIVPQNLGSKTKENFNVQPANLSDRILSDFSIEDKNKPRYKNITEKFPKCTDIIRIPFNMQKHLSSIEQDAKHDEGVDSLYLVEYNKLNIDNADTSSGELDTQLLGMTNNREIDYIQNLLPKYKDDLVIPLEIRNVETMTQLPVTVSRKTELVSDIEDLVLGIEESSEVTNNSEEIYAKDKSGNSSEPFDMYNSKEKPHDVTSHEEYTLHNMLELFEITGTDKNLKNEVAEQHSTMSMEQFSDFPNSFDAKCKSIILAEPLNRSKDEAHDASNIKKYILHKMPESFNNDKCLKNEIADQDGIISVEESTEVPKYSKEQFRKRKSSNLSELFKDTNNSEDEQPLSEKEYILSKSALFKILDNHLENKIAERDRSLKLLQDGSNVVTKDNENIRDNQLGLYELVNSFQLLDSYSQPAYNDVRNSNPASHSDDHRPDNDNSADIGAKSHQIKHQPKMEYQSDENSNNNLNEQKPEHLDALNSFELLDSYSQLDYDHIENSSLESHQGKAKIESHDLHANSNLDDDKEEPVSLLQSFKLPDYHRIDNVNNVDISAQSRQMNYEPNMKYQDENAYNNLDVQKPEYSDRLNSLQLLDSYSLQDYDLDNTTLESQRAEAKPMMEPYNIHTYTNPDITEESFKLSDAHRPNNDNSADTCAESKQVNHEPKMQNQSDQHSLSNLNEHKTEYSDTLNSLELLQLDYVIGNSSLESHQAEVNSAEPPQDIHEPKMEYESKEHSYKNIDEQKPEYSDTLNSFELLGSYSQRADVENSSLESHQTESEPHNLHAYSNSDDEEEPLSLLQSFKLPYVLTLESDNSVDDSAEEILEPKMEFYIDDHSYNNLNEHKPEHSNALNSLELLDSYSQSTYDDLENRSLELHMAEADSEMESYNLHAYNNPDSDEEEPLLLLQSFNLPKSHRPNNENSVNKRADSKMLNNEPKMEHHNNEHEYNNLNEQKPEHSFELLGSYSLPTYDDVENSSLESYHAEAESTTESYNLYAYNNLDVDEEEPLSLLQSFKLASAHKLENDNSIGNSVEPYKDIHGPMLEYQGDEHSYVNLYEQMPEYTDTLNLFELLDSYSQTDYTDVKNSGIKLHQAESKTQREPYNLHAYSNANDDEEEPLTLVQSFKLPKAHRSNNDTSADKTAESKQVNHELNMEYQSDEHSYNDLSEQKTEHSHALNSFELLGSYSQPNYDDAEDSGLELHDAKTELKMESYKQHAYSNPDHEEEPLSLLQSFTLPQAHRPNNDTSADKTAESKQANYEVNMEYQSDEHSYNDLSEQKTEHSHALNSFELLSSYSQDDIENSRLELQDTETELKMESYNQHAYSNPDYDEEEPLSLLQSFKLLEAHRSNNNNNNNADKSAESKPVNHKTKKEYQTDEHSYNNLNKQKPEYSYALNSFEMLDSYSEPSSNPVNDTYDFWNFISISSEHLMSKNYSADVSSDESLQNVFVDEPDVIKLKDPYQKQNTPLLTNALKHKHDTGVSKFDGGIFENDDIDFNHSMSISDEIIDHDQHLYNIDFLNRYIRSRTTIASNTDTK